MKIKPIVINVSIFSASILFVFLALEATLRVAGYEGERERLNSTFSSYYDHVEKDSWIFEYRSNPITNTVNINGRNVPVEKAAEENRILFIGDSGTLGFGVPISLNFPNTFKSFLDENGKGENVTVINAGVSGMTTIAEYQLLKNQLLHLKPDTVVLGLFMANDINFNLMHHERKLQHTTTAGVSRFFYFLRQRSALVHFIHLRLLVLNNKYRIFSALNLDKGTYVPVEFRSIDENGYDMGNYLSGEIATYRKEHSTLMKRAFNVLEKIFYQFKILALKNNFKFCVVIIPTPSAIVGEFNTPKRKKPIETMKKYYNITVDLTELDVLKPTRKVLDICSKLKILCIDPTPEMQEIGMAAVRKDDDHLSVAGHNILARKLYDHHKLLGIP